MTDADLTVRYRTAGGDVRRVRFVPSARPCVTHQRIEEEWTGERWRPVGQEWVTGLRRDGEPIRTGSGVVERGP